MDKGEGEGKGDRGVRKIYPPDIKSDSSKVNVYRGTLLNLPEHQFPHLSKAQSEEVPSPPHRPKGQSTRVKGQ